MYNEIVHYYGIYASASGILGALSFFISMKLRRIMMILNIINIAWIMFLIILSIIEKRDASKICKDIWNYN